MLLTLNEEANIVGCLRSLARQRRRDFEVIVIDAASADRTVHHIENAQKGFPVPLRLVVAKRRVSIGEARNHGVRLARAPYVAFLSADAQAHPRWVEEAMRSLGAFDMVFGRQVHAPHRWTVGASVRGLRYHFPPGPAPDPLVYASNVAAAYKKEVLQTFPFDAWANAAEDVLLARRAHAAGFRAEYNPHMIVHHHDVSHARDEIRKSVREGRGWGAYADELGLFGPVVAWGLAILVALVLLLLLPSPATAMLLAAVVWMPALRRALLRRHHMPIRHVFVGALASPVFDAAFLLAYVRGLLGRNRAPTPTETKELQA